MFVFAVLPGYFTLQNKLLKEGGGPFGMDTSALLELIEGRLMPNLPKISLLLAGRPELYI